MGGGLEGEVRPQAESYSRLVRGGGLEGEARLQAEPGTRYVGGGGVWKVKRDRSGFVLTRTLPKLFYIINIMLYLVFYRFSCF